MKVLYVLENPDNFNKSNRIGGYLSHVIGIVEGFNLLGFEIVVASYHKIPYLDDNKITYAEISETKTKLPFLDGIYHQYNLISQLLRVIETEKPNIIYLRWIGNLFLSRIKKYFPDVAIVVECNGFKGMQNQSFNMLRAKIIRSQYNQYIKNASVISAITDDVRNSLLEKIPGADKANIIVNPNGVDVEKFRPMSSTIRGKYGISSKSIIIGFSGYFMPWHKIEDLIDAIKGIESEVTLLLIGSGDSVYLDALRKKAKHHKKGRIIFTGPIEFDKMPLYLAACDILVVPQDKENSFRSPIKLFEYMAMGKAIAAVNVGQMPKVINDGVNGMLFEPDYQDLRRVLLELIQNESLRNKLGKQAREDAAIAYTWEANIKRVMSELEN